MFFKSCTLSCTACNFFLLPALATLFSLYRMVRFTFCFVLAFPTNLRRKCAQTRYTIHRDSPLLFAFVHQIQLVFLEVRSLFYFADPANKIYYKWQKVFIKNKKKLSVFFYSSLIHITIVILGFSNFVYSRICILHYIIVWRPCDGEKTQHKTVKKVITKQLMLWA